MGNKAGSQTPAQQPTVLIAECDRVMRELLRVHVQNLGYNVLLAADGAAAGRSVLQGSNEIGALIVSAQLPYMSGMELVATMIADTSLRFIPTIMICPSEADARRADTLGVPALIPPFSAEQLRDLLHSALESEGRPTVRTEPRSMRQRLDDLTAPVEPLKKALRIVIADDEPDTVTSLMAILCIEGHRVFGSRNSPDIMPEVRRNKPDVVILDIDMPKISGFALARDIREMYGDSSPLLIAVSGKWVGQTDRMLAEQAGFDHFIQKPCHPDALLALLEQPVAPS